MNTKQYLAAIAKCGDSYDNNWHIMASNKEQTLFLVKDGNSICYVSTPDLVAIMPYNLALAEKKISHFAGSSPVQEVKDAISNHQIGEDELVGIDLTTDDIAWLNSESVSSLVRSIESVV